MVTLSIGRQAQVRVLISADMEGVTGVTCPDATQAVGACTGVPGVEQTGPRTVAFTLPTMARAIRCFRVVTVLAAASIEPRYG